jgi:hypothetical protein
MYDDVQIQRYEMSGNVHLLISNISIEIEFQTCEKPAVGCIFWAQTIERGNALSPPSGQSYESS